MISTDVIICQYLILLDCMHLKERNLLDHFIPYGKQYIDNDDINAVVKVLRSDLITTGPVAEEFEKALAKSVGAKYVVVFSSGTAALHASYYVAGLKKGEEVITSPITFAATANAALYVQGKPVFVDISSDSFGINIDKIKDAITPKTKIIAPVDMAGIPVDIDRIMDIADTYNLVVVEDAAHALGAIYKGKSVGSTAHMTVFSFHPVKHITTGEGGAVATNSKTFYEKLQLFRSHGIEKNPALLLDKKAGPWHQEMQLLGYNYRLTDIQCALGLSQLKKLGMFINRRREIVDIYNDSFINNKNIAIPKVPFDCIPSWHLYILRLSDNLDKKQIAYRLYERNISTQVHYIPVYRHPYYSEMNEPRYRSSEFSNAESFYRQALSIPLYPTMSELEITEVIKSVTDLCC